MHPSGAHPERVTSLLVAKAFLFTFADIQYSIVLLLLLCYQPRLTSLILGEKQPPVTRHSCDLALPYFLSRVYLELLLELQN